MNKKQDNANVNADVVVDCPELENVFNFDKEVACWSGQFADFEEKIPYARWPPVEQTKWENFRAKYIDVKSGKWYTDGESTGICKGKQGPKRIVSSIIRLKTADNSEYLLSSSNITAYDAHGDIQKMTAHLPEKYNKTIFRFETVPNHETGFSERRNIGPSGSELVYTLPFSKENAQKLFDLRDGNNSNNNAIQFIVKSDEGQVIGVKPQITVNDTFKLFVENDFEYLYHANYIPQAQKLLNAKQAENEGLIPKQTDDERAASILAQESLSDKQKHIAIQ